MTIKKCIISGLVTALLLSSAPVQAVDQGLEIQMKGNLLEDACTVNEGDTNLQVALRTVTDKDLYENTRGPATAFQIRLEECDPGVAENVRISFSGTASEGLPGYLAVSGVEGNMGFAIGIETPAGIMLKLNDINSAHELAVQEGMTIIALQAFLQAEPLAVTNKNIKLGEYNSTATFMLEYL